MLVLLVQGLDSCTLSGKDVGHLVSHGTGVFRGHSGNVIKGKYIATGG